jgi:hypothetical protein
MPLTTTTAWPDLIDGKKAVASQVELKFDWMEGDIWPMKGGSTTTGVYNIGHASYQWKYGYFDNIILNGVTMTSAIVNTPEAWISIYSTGGVYTIGSSFNIASVTNPTTGTYILNFTNSFQSSSAYSAVGAATGYVLVTDKSTSSMKIEHRNYSTDALELPINLGMMIIGTLA